MANNQSVRLTSGCFYPRSNHWEVGGRPQCDKCGCRVPNCSQHRFGDFGDNFKLQEQLWGSVVVVHEEPHHADDRYIVLQARKNRRQTFGSGEIVDSGDTDALYGAVPLTPAHRRRRSLWCREYWNWRDNEWGRVLFTDESRFSLSSDYHRIPSGERGSRNHPSNIIERDRGAAGLQFLFMDDSAPCHRTVAAEQHLESEDIEPMDWPARSPESQSHRACMGFLGRRLAARTLPPVMIREPD
ncbi:transposable element Tcb1 transposase [Trichonephila clavipes]|nr:transposable element Tcb1 transposase [Trichonephila clavipes]